jgi:hypothetical protein
MTDQPNNVSAAGVLTDEQITAAARALSNHNADVCNVNREDNWMIYGDDFRESAKVALLAAASAQATAPVGWFVQRSSFGPWIEVERYEDGAVRLHRMDGDQATGQAVQFTPSQLATLYMALGHFKSSGSVKCADSIMSIIKMDRG